MIQPPLPDLPPPVFPVETPPPARRRRPSRSPRRRPPCPRPQRRKRRHPLHRPRPRQYRASQVAYLTPPSPLYPASSRRSGETGTVTVRVLIDASGRPTTVSVQRSSGFSALDESAASAVRAARFRPYAEGGVPQAVWVLVPINFVLQ
jgi:protein TonB